MTTPGSSVKVGDDVTPTLVVVDTQGDDEVLASVGLETKGTAGSAAAHGEHMGSVDFRPRSAVSVVSRPSSRRRGRTRSGWSGRPVR
jgi:hypothetical protein